VAEITASGLLSAVVIDIRSGSSDRYLEPGSRIQGAEAANVFAVASTAAGELTDLMRDTIRPLLESVEEETPEILAQVEALAADLGRAVERMNALLSPANTERVTRTVRNVESASANFSSVSQDLIDTQRRLDELLVDLRQMLGRRDGELGQAVHDLHDSLESVARHIDAINDNLETTTRNLSEFSEKIRRNPAALIRGQATEADGPEDR
jgi:phospholipid/cholesterol/gamma-HCH transport system substrate-binding protein